MSPDGKGSKHRRDRPFRCGHIKGQRIVCSVDRNKRPNVAHSGATVFLAGVLLLLADEAPDLVQLNNSAIQVPHRHLHNLRAAFANADAQAHDRITMDARHALDAANAIPLG